MRINPVCRKELKLSVRSVKIANTILVFNSILAFIGLFLYYIYFDVVATYAEIDYSKIFIVYVMISVIELALVLFIVPAYTAGCIAGERERQTLDILLTTKLTPGQIIRGKLTCSISLLLFLVFSSLPILAIVFSIGGVNYQHLMQLLMLILVAAIFVGSIGIFFSTILKKTIPATVFTYGAVVFLIIGTVAVVGVVYSIVMINHDYTATIQATKGIGNGVLILLWNPAVTMGSMMARQFGSYVSFKEEISNMGDCNKFVLDHWFEISLTVQLLLSMIFIGLATKLLNPIRKPTKKQIQI